MDRDLERLFEEAHDPYTEIALLQLNKRTSELKYDGIEKRKSGTPNGAVSSSSSDSVPSGGET